MLFQVKRLRSDLRGAKLWLATIAVASFVISAITSYLAAFSLTDLRAGTLSVDPPAHPLSFLRVVDPDGSIVTVIDDPRDWSRFNEPGLSVLLDRLGRDDRMFLTLSLGAFMGNRAHFSERPTSGQAVVGISPAFLRDAAPAGPGPMLWGAVPRGFAGLSDDRIGPLQVRRVSDTPLSRRYVAGDGRRSDTGNEALLWLSPENARTLGVSLPSVSAVVDALTCACDARELAPLARTMTLADQAAGSHRVYYALGYDGLIGPVERSTSAMQALDVVHAAGTLLGVCGFAYLAVLLFWKRREHDYTVEQRAGAGEAALQLRQQVILFAGVTLPVSAGFFVVDGVIRADMTVPWPPFGGPATPAVIIAFHVVLGFSTARSVHRLYRRPDQE